MTRVVKKLRTGTSFRTTLNYSPESKGDCERRHQTTLGQVKTLASELQTRYELTTPLDTQLSLYHWLVKHSCFLVNRFLRHSDGKTSFYSRMVQDYQPPLFNFAETVLFRMSQKTPNSLTKWGKC